MHIIATQSGLHGHAVRQCGGVLHKRSECVERVIAHRHLRQLFLIEMLGPHIQAANPFRASGAEQMGELAERRPLVSVKAVVGNIDLATEQRHAALGAEYAVLVELMPERHSQDNF